MNWIPVSSKSEVLAMNICLACTIFPPAIGGPSFQSLQLASALALRGHKVTVVTPANPNRKNIRQELPSEISLVESHAVTRGIRGIVIWNLSIAFAVFRVLRRHKFDVLHCQSGPSVSGLLIGLVTRFLKVPSMAKFPGDEVSMRVNARKRTCMDRQEVYKLNWQTRIRTRLQLGALQSFDLLWAPSTFQRDNLVNLFGIRPERIILMPNYVNLAINTKTATAGSAERPIIICVCRLIALKGVDLLLNVFAQVPRNIRGEFWIIGDGIKEVETELKDLAIELGIQKEVRFLGRVEPAKIPEYMQKADIFLHTLYHRWAGIVFLEALASGLCIVSLNLGSWPEQEEFEKVPALIGQDIPQTTQLLQQALQDPAIRKACVQKGQEYVRQFDLQQNLDKFISSYNTAISLHKI